MYRYINNVLDRVKIFSIAINVTASVFINAGLLAKFVDLYAYYKQIPDPCLEFTDELHCTMIFALNKYITDITALLFLN